MKRENFCISINDNDYCTLNQSLILKEMGFNLKVNHYFNDNNEFIEAIADYNNEDSYNSADTAYDDFNHGYSEEVLCSAPTLEQARMWLKKNKEIDIIVVFEQFLYPEYPYMVEIYESHQCVYLKERNGYFSEYPFALSMGITEICKFLNS